MWVRGKHSALYQMADKTATLLYIFSTRARDMLIEVQSFFFFLYCGLSKII